MSGHLVPTLRSSAIRLTCAVLSAVGGVVIARGLQPDGRGAFAVVTTLAAITLSAGHLSVELAQTALWREGRRVIPSNALLLGAVVGLLATVGALAVVWALGPAVVPLPSFGLALIGLLSVPASMVVLYLNGVLVLQARVNVVNRSLLVTSVTYAVLLLGGAFTHRLSVPVVVWVWAVSVGLPLIVLVPAVRPRLREIDIAFARRTVVHGLRYHGSFVAWFLLLRLDVLILNGLSTQAAVGLYSTAVTVAELSRIITDSGAMVAQSGQADSDLKDSAVATVRATRLSTLLAAAAVGGMCLVAPVGIPLLYGHAFAGSVPALLALAPGLFALGATRALGTYLLRLDRPLLNSAFTVAAMGVNVALCLFLIPRWGIVGCALASSLGYLVLGGCQLAWFVHATGVRLTHLVTGRMELAQLRRAVSTRPDGRPENWTPRHRRGSASAARTGRTAADTRIY